MAFKRGRGFSLNYLFASFFGAAMIAGAFAYFNYKFSEYKFIDFNKWIFYEKRDIFKPKEDKYLLLLYSSKMSDLTKLKEKILKNSYKILALDIYQTRPISTNKLINITSGTNTILKVIQRFNIYEVPSVLLIKRIKGSLYKQDSKVMTF
jgi:pyruvate/2-oxoacid:ferredoxin oxidoreductase alpha subunit